MTHEVMDQTWRYQCELMSGSTSVHVEVFTDMCTYMGQYTYLYFFDLQLRGCRGNDTPAAMSTRSLQMLLSNTMLQ